MGRTRSPAANRFPKFGEIYECQLGPVIGSEIAKRRPAIVVSNNRNNQFSQTVTIVPLTSQPAKRTYPFEVALSRGSGGLRRDSRARADQIRTVDKSRLTRYLGALPAQHMERVQDSIRVHLNLR